MGKYAKAIIGAIVAGAGSLQLALADEVVTNTEWIKVASAFLVALGLVWGVQNTPAAPSVKTFDDGGADAGSGLLEMIIGCLVILILAAILVNVIH